MLFKAGDIVEGKIEKLTKFGAFVKLPGDETGLVHISEVDSKYVKNIEEFLQLGQVVSVKVLAVKGEGKIDLSIKEAMKKSEPIVHQPLIPAASFEDKLADFLKNSEEKQNTLKKRLTGNKKKAKK